jgi:hypothetical protein
VMDVAREAAQTGASVLLTVLTAKHATRMKQKTRNLRGITVDTCHGAFKLGYSYSTYRVYIGTEHF